MAVNMGQEGSDSDGELERLEHQQVVETSLLYILFSL